MTLLFKVILNVSSCTIGLPTKSMTNDDSERILVCLRVLSSQLPGIVDIFTQNCRQALSSMLVAKAEEEASTQKVGLLVSQLLSMFLLFIEIAEEI